MSFHSEPPIDGFEDLMPQAPLPATLVWAAAGVLVGVAVVGLFMGLRQAPGGGGPGAFDIAIGDSPAVASASAAAKPLTGDKWSTLSGPQIATAAPDTAPSAPDSGAPPSSHASTAHSAAAAAAPPDDMSTPDAAPSAPAPSVPSQTPAPAQSSQPDSMQNYY